jgi:hypothetical protein
MAFVSFSFKRARVIPVYLSLGQTTSSPTRTLTTSSPLRILSTDQNYKFFSGVIIERLPRIAPKEPGWVEEKNKFQQRVEAQKLKTLKLQPIKTIIEHMDDAIENQGVDKRSRLTKSETNLQSLNRKMDKSLYFIIRKPNTSFEWQFPHIAYQQGETLRQTAERANITHTPQFSLYILSNSPDIHYDINTNNLTNRIFLYRTYHMHGKPILGDGVTDFAWVTKEELPKYFQPQLFHSIKDILLE